VEAMRIVDGVRSGEGMGLVLGEERQFRPCRYGRKRGVGFGF